MLKAILARVQQGHRTLQRLPAASALPDRFRGLPRIDRSGCESDCRACVDQCPTHAISCPESTPLVDLGRCIFCARCAEVCPAKCITYSQDFALAARHRNDLIMGRQGLKPVAPLHGPIHQLLGRSLKLRQVSAGGCNACEADINVLNTVVFDLGRFGVQFVASPRHADGLLVTGPIPDNMRLALEKTYAAVPTPKIVIAAGACAISGGLFAGNSTVATDISSILPVDLFIPGCPPHPLTTLKGLLDLLGHGSAS